MSPAQWYAPKVTRFMHEHGVGQEALRAIALASYHHAQANPRAVMYGRPLTEEGYDEIRWITEPFHLYDCCQENDGAAALILVPAERAKDLKQTPAYVLGAAIGAGYRVHSTPAGFATPDLASSHFQTLAPRLYEMAGVGPADVDVVQCYENFTGGVLMALVEHGFFAPGRGDGLPEAGEPDRARRQAAAQHQRRQPRRMLHARAGAADRGGAPAARPVDRQVPDAEVSLAVAGPMVTPVSTIILGSEATL